MKRFIVIPLYDHTTPDEAIEICEALEEVHQFSNKPYIGVAQNLPNSPYTVGNTWTKGCAPPPKS